MAAGQTTSSGELSSDSSINSAQNILVKVSNVLINEAEIISLIHDKY